MKPKQIENKVMYCYFAPDGYIQVRSLSGTRKHCREMISHGEPDYTWKDYEKEGYRLGKVMVGIHIMEIAK